MIPIAKKTAKNSMPQIPLAILVQNSQWLARIEKSLSRKQIPYIVCQSMTEAEDLLNYENCQIFITDLLDNKPDQAMEVFQRFFHDPWLHGSIIIGIAESMDQKQFKEFSRWGVIDIIHGKDIAVKFELVITVITANLPILYQSHFIQSDKKVMQRTIKIRNNLRHVPVVINHIMTECYAMGFRDISRFSTLSLTLSELIINAIEHGNCGITHEEKSLILEGRYTTEEIIAERANLPENRNKFVHIAYQIKPTEARFIIRDEGKGFDSRQLPDPNDDDNLLKSHGRGILLSMHNVDKLTYNEIGNEVRIRVSNDPSNHRINSFPLNIDAMNKITLAPNQTLFEEKSISDNFYFVVKGRLGIFLNDRLIAKAGPEDIFVGEMSFLLNNRRTSTVRALTTTTLIPISKKEFINLIKNYPYIGVFLARLLAGRLEGQNRQLSRFKYNL